MEKVDIAERYNDWNQLFGDEIGGYHGLEHVILLPDETHGEGFAEATEDLLKTLLVHEVVMQYKPYDNELFVGTGVAKRILALVKMKMYEYGVIIPKQ